MTDKITKCSNYIEGSLSCKSGFISNHPVCWGGRTGCVSCGSTENLGKPNCEKDHLPDHWVTDSGKGVFR